ncbi:pro-resilin-like [Macrobrachium rosenbergii]|uniref:pro-resilin-like n=1 Tax=Macrobrachium rosenbergii TaxID=79674 RepID=UPI0034D4B69D
MAAFLKVIVVTVMLVSATALPQYDAANLNLIPPSESYSAPDEAGGPASYSFSYENSDPATNNYYGHAEQREGPNSSGEYRVLLPDGRTQIVKYTVEGDVGYIAKISYERPSGGANLAVPNTGDGYQ